MESRRRSVLKAVIWSGLGLIMMTTIGYFATGSISTGGWLALANTAIGTATYVIYERVWAGIRWGLHGGA